MRKKITDSRLEYKHLYLAYRRDGANGIRNLLAEKIGRRVTVTASSKVLDATMKAFLDHHGDLSNSYPTVAFSSSHS